MKYTEAPIKFTGALRRRLTIVAGPGIAKQQLRSAARVRRLRSNPRWQAGAAFAAVTTLLMATGCSSEHCAPAPDASALERAKTMTPSDSRLAGLYRQSCHACHSTGAAGAPLTGERTAWDARWSKGVETLRSSTISGLNGMPPGGQCFGCTPQDYDELIRFMAGR